MDMDHLIAEVKTRVLAQTQHIDPSHDFHHILRVVRLAQSILAHERARPNAPTYRDHLITLSALLHDLEDHKYKPRTPSSTSTSTSSSFPTDASTSKSPAEHAVFDLLCSLGADIPLAFRVQRIVTHVSYSREQSDPESVKRVLEAIPELAIVQDADRLDALGAVGIARCFTYMGSRYKGTGGAGGGGVDESDGGVGGGLESCIEHMDEKLLRLEGMMKTETGREMARERTRRVTEFRGWWDEEVETSLTWPAGQGGDEAP